MENVKIQDLFSFHFLSSLTLSPDKTRAALVVQKANGKDNGYDGDIYLYEIASGAVRRLTSQGDGKSYTWLDDTTLIFPSAKRNKALTEASKKGEPWTVYYSIDVTGGEAVEFMRVPLSVTAVKPLGGDLFALTAKYNKYAPDLHSLCGEEKEKAIADRKAEKDYEVLDELPYWSNGAGFVNKDRNRLYLFDKSTGKLTPVTAENETVGLLKTKDGKLLYISTSYDDILDQASGLYLYDIASGEKKTLVCQDEDWKLGYADFLRDKIIVAATDRKAHGMNTAYNFYVVGEKGLELIAENDYSIASTLGSDVKLGKYGGYHTSGDSLFFITTRGHANHIGKVTLGCDKVELIGEPIGSIDDFDLGDDCFYFIGQRGMRLPELYSLCGKEEKRLTSFNEEYFTTHAIATPEPCFFENDGITLEGWVIPPYGYDPSKKYPAVIDIHGGPKTAFGTVFFHEMQAWAGMGYFVFFMNPRGSDGRGDAFAELRGAYGTYDYDDLMKFTDAVIAKYPAIDTARMGVTGGSYGGFMTNWIIGHTDRFACAASQRSISNWVSFSNTTDIGYRFGDDQMAANTWDNVEKMWWHSPLKYADQVKTPTLFIHSDEDYRCWLVEGLQMFTALKLHGVESRLCMFHGENHELSRGGKPNHRIRRLDEITNWFEKFLK